MAISRSPARAEPGERNGKHLIVAGVVAGGRQQRGVVEGVRAQMAVLQGVGGHVAGHRGAAAVADQKDLSAALMGLGRERHPALDGLFGRDGGAALVGDDDATQPGRDALEVVGPADHDQMTIFAIVRNSGSVIGRSLQRRCDIAAAPMLPARATIRAGSPREAARLLSAK